MELLLPIGLAALHPSGGWPRSHGQQSCPVHPEAIGLWAPPQSCHAAAWSTSSACDGRFFLATQRRPPQEIGDSCTSTHCLIACSDAGPPHQVHVPLISLHRICRLQKQVHMHHACLVGYPGAKTCTWVAWSVWLLRTPAAGQQWQSVSPVGRPETGSPDLQGSKPRQQLCL